jgi:hypothetical protein
MSTTVINCQGCKGLVVLQSDFYSFFNTPEILWIGDNKVFYGFFIRAQLLPFGFIHSKTRNSLGPEKVKKLVYIKTNYAAVADVVRPCESDDDSDSDSPFPVDSD